MLGYVTVWNDQKACLSCIRPFNRVSPASCGSDLLPVAAGNYSHSVCVSAWWMTPAPVEQSLPGALLFFFLTFAWEQGCMHSQAKTNSDNYLICMMYDLLSLDDKLSDDLECLVPTRLQRYKCYQWGRLLVPSHKSNADAESTNPSKQWCCAFWHLTSLFGLYGRLMQYLEQKRNFTAVKALRMTSGRRNEKPRRGIRTICCHGIKISVVSRRSFVSAAQLAFTLCLGTECIRFK